MTECNSSMKTHDCIKEIFKDSDINYQIPATGLTKLRESNIIGCTALHLSLQDDLTDSFEELLKLGADFTIRNDKGMTVLHQAVQRSHNKSRECWKLKGQLMHPRASLILSAHVEQNNMTNPCNNHGMSHFHIACMLNHTKAVQFFLDSRVSANKIINEGSTRLPGYTPLHIAARYCCFETVQLLLQHGADKNCRDAKNMTPLHLLLKRRIEITDHMHMHKRATYDFFDEELDLNTKIIKLFINIEDCNATDAVGLSAFQVSCTLQDNTLVRKMLRQDVDLSHAVSENSPVWPGYTALHFSVHCNFDTVKLLLSRGANALAKDARGVTPLDLCLKMHNVENLHVVLILMQAVSQFNLEDILFSDGKTKLVDLVYAMRSVSMLNVFVRAAANNTNIFIPHDSPVWPGYTPMHLAVVLPDRKLSIEVLYRTTDYVEEECSKKHYECDETEKYNHRIVFLLQAGADVTIRDARGSTPIHLAFPWKSQIIFRLLFNSQREILNPVDERGFSHLHIACATQQGLFVERILAALSESIDDQTTSLIDYPFVNHGPINAGSTMLHIAVTLWDYDMINTLVSHKANIYIKNSLGMTPIHLILKNADMEPRPTESSESSQFCRLLQSVDNWTECVTDHGLSHLHVASYMNDAGTIRKLLDAGTNIETTIKYKPSQELSYLAKYDSYTPLHMARHNSIYGLYVFAPILKSDAAVQKRLSDCFGWTALHIACINYDVDWAEELLKNGADPNALTNSNFLGCSGCSPLHIAATNNVSNETDIKMLKLLVEHGADVTLVDSKGCTPVHEFFGSLRVTGNKYVELLLEYQKDYSVNPINAEGLSHFHAACTTNNATIVEEFLKHGVDVNLRIIHSPMPCRRFRFHHTPLHLAVELGHHETIDLLLRYGANVNARDCLGNSPLHCVPGHSPEFEITFEKLVSAGADVHARNLLGATILETIISTCSDSRSIKLLTRRGHRVNSFNPLTREGLVGLAMCLNSDYSSNPFYTAVIEASGASDFDDMDRSPLHNIVSCRGFDYSCEAITELLKIGYEINGQDKRGRTALHCASFFHNDEGHAGLLKCGADINITDANNLTAFTYFLERKSGRWNCEKRYPQIIFLKHIYKLNLLKLSVNEPNRNAYAETIRKVDLQERFIRECQNELERAKSKTVEPLSISLFDLLSSETRMIAAYPYMPLPRRQDIDEYFETNQYMFRQEFRHFSSLLYLQHRKALAREELVESAKYPLNMHLGLDVPDLCSNVIFQFLANEDLRNLISSEELPSA